MNFDAEIARITEEAGDDINKQIAAAQEIQNMINSAQSGDRVIYSGVDSSGPGLGWISMAIAALAVVVSVFASGAVGGGEQRRWKASAVQCGLGLALMIVPMAFVLGIVRVGALIPWSLLGILFVSSNIFIGVFNLVPLLPFDGGHAAIATYERIREAISKKRHHADVAKLMPLTYATLAVLLLMFAVVTWDDLFNFPI